MRRIDAIDARRPRRVQYGRVVLLVLASFLIVGLVAAIANYIYQANRQGALALSNNLLDSLDRRIETQLITYLAPAEHLASTVLHQLEDTRPLPERRRVIELTARGAMLPVRQISALSVADRDGNFVFVRRNEHNTFDTKVIDVREGRRVRWIYRDANGRTLREEDDPDDTFDARTRPWFTGALETGAPYWTEAYVFFTVRKPGITFAIPDANQPNQSGLIVGVDIELDEVSRFLSTLEIGVKGRALVIDGKGHIIAYPQAQWQPPVKDGKAELPRLDELGDPALTRAYNRIRIEGHGRQVIAMDQQRVIVTSEALKALTGRDWSLLVVVPEDDFVGFVATSGRVAGLMSLGALAVVVAMTGFLAWQGVRADRRAASALSQQRSLEAQGQAFAQLAQMPGLHDPESTEGLATATELAATACSARRVSVWRISPDRRSLHCEDCFDAAAGGHTTGSDLHRLEIHRFFDAIEAGRSIAVDRAADDRATQELARTYLGPLGIQSLHAFPIRDAEKTAGVVMFEGTAGVRAQGVAEFGAALASLLTLRMIRRSGVNTTPPAIPVPPSTRPDTLPTDEGPPHGDVAVPVEIATAAEAAGAVQRQSAVLQQLVLSNLPPGDDRVHAFNHAPVVSLALPDWVGVSAVGPDRKTQTLDHIVRLVQRTARERGLAYAAILDDRVLLAALPAATAVHEPALIRAAAEAALDLRDGLVGFSDEIEREIAFGIGIDVGLALLGQLGEEPAVSNLWGTAVRSAVALATSTQPATIVASEAAYGALQTDFLFRPSGRYLLPDAGVVGTYVLIGRL
jgi:adenylate cyclase